MYILFVRVFKCPGRELLSIFNYKTFVFFFPQNRAFLDFSLNSHCKHANLKLHESFVWQSGIGGGGGGGGGGGRDAFFLLQK